MRFFSKLFNNNIHITYPILSDIFRGLSLLIPIWSPTLEAWESESVSLNIWIVVPILVGALFIPLSQKIRWIYVVLNSMQLSQFAVILYLNYLFKNDLDSFIEYVESIYSGLWVLWSLGFLFFIGLHYLLFTPILGQKYRSGCR